MAQYIVQSNGNITVRYQIDDEVLSFRINADNGVPFAPDTVVSIADERLDALAATLAQAFGSVNIQRIPDDYENATG
jgi:predicted RNase H-like nuclease